MRKSLSLGVLLAAAFVAAFSFVTAASAQTTGGIKGKVRNMRGETVADASVTARFEGKDTKSAKTNSKGEFSLTGLDPGVYNIVFDAKGYSLGIKYSVEVKANKTVDLGERLILQVDKGTQVIVQGSVFDKNGASLPAVKVEVEKVNGDGSTRKLGTVWTNVYGEFVFRQPEANAKFRMTVRYHDATATKDIDVEAAGIYRLAISLDVERQR